MGYFVLYLKGTKAQKVYPYDSDGSYKDFQLARATELAKLNHSAGYPCTIEHFPGHCSYAGSLVFDSENQ